VIASEDDQAHGQGLSIEEEREKTKPRGETVLEWSVHAEEKYVQKTCKRSIPWWRTSVRHYKHSVELARDGKRGGRLNIRHEAILGQGRVGDGNGVAAKEERHEGERDVRIEAELARPQVELERIVEAHERLHDP
jgi:hypothetical protein